MKIVFWIMLVASSSPVVAAVECLDREAFLVAGWEQAEVQHAMDMYLRDHKMRVNWMQEPRPPNAVGRDYYEWLWIDEFGAAMKAELVQRFCGAGPLE